MSVRIGQLSLVEPVRDGSATPGVTSPIGAAHVAPKPHVTADVLPTTPPEELSEQVAAAAARAQELHAAGRELHFAKDPLSNRIVVQVRSLDGTVIRTVPPSKALDIMSGHAIV